MQTISETNSSPQIVTETTLHLTNLNHRRPCCTSPRGNVIDSPGWSFGGTCVRLSGLSPHTCGSGAQGRTPPERHHRPVVETMAYLGEGARRRSGAHTRSWRTTSASWRVSQILRRLSLFRRFVGTTWLSFFSFFFFFFFFYDWFRMVLVSSCSWCCEGSSIQIWLFSQRCMCSHQL